MTTLLSKITVTKSKTGYPGYDGTFVHGFETFEEALAYRNGVNVSLTEDQEEAQIVYAKIRDGWSFCNVIGEVDAPFYMQEEILRFGNAYDHTTEENIKDELDQAIEQDDEQLQAYYFDLLQSVSSEGIALLYNGKFQEMMPTTTMSYRHDVYTHMIGVHIK